MTTKNHRIQTRVEFVTPEIATRWLEQNESNRNVTQATVERYARDMKAGKWKLTGEPLIFADTGRLLNGQHRCWACILADVGFYSSVTRGVPDADEVMDVLDSGDKRTFADALQIRGEKDGALLASIAALCWRYERNRCVNRSMPSRPEGFQWLADNPGAREAVHVARVATQATKAQVTPIGAAYYLNARVDAPAAEEFWRLASTGEGLSAGDPVLAWRRYVLSVLGSRDRKPLPEVWLAVNMKAMTLWRQGRKSRLLSWKSAEGMPEVWK